MDRKPNATEELVEIFDTQEESEAMVIQGLLEANGVDAMVSGLDAPQNVLPGVGGVVVRVAPEKAAEARRIIAENRNPSPDDEASGGPAA